MSTQEQPKETEKVSCDVCMKEITASEAKNDEASDYVRHICVLDCYDKWKKQHPSSTKDD